MTLHWITENITFATSPTSRLFRIKPMKTSLICRLSVALISAAISFSSPVFGEETTDMLSKARDLVQQANPTGNPPSDAQRIQSLTQALKLTQEAPNHRLKGHRVQAIQDIKAALAEIRKGDPNHKAPDYLCDAQSELSASVSLVSKSDAPQAAARPTPSKYPIQDAAHAGDLEKVKALLQSDPNLAFSKDGFDVTPLLAASTTGHKDVVEMLLAYKADVNAKDCFDLTPLHYAAQGGYKELAALLIANKADVNARDNQGLTPLHCAHKDVAELLLSNGADINAKATHGGAWSDDTPLWIAACNGHKDVAQTLLANKADATIAGKDGLTPLGIAQAHHHDDVADLLQQKPSAATNAGSKAADTPPMGDQAQAELKRKLSDIVKSVVTAAAKGNGKIIAGLISQEYRGEDFSKNLEPHISVDKGILADFDYYNLIEIEKVILDKDIAFVQAKIAYRPDKLAEIIQDEKEAAGTEEHGTSWTSFGGTSSSNKCEEAGVGLATYYTIYTVRLVERLER
ncbi:MAG: ankyrin repeat domain-containing protein [Verrucomicrobiota bacterium]